MDEREELKEELEQELQWVQYRQKMLDIIEEKLLQIKQLAEKAKANNLSLEEIKVLNDKINKILAQIKALDSESARIANERIFK